MISAGIIIPLMLFTIMVLQLTVYSELYQDSRACYPIVYWFGETSGCKQMITRLAHQTIQIKDLRESIGSRITYQESFSNGIEQTKNIWNTFSGLLQSFHKFLHGILHHIRTFRRNIHHEMILPTLTKASLQ